MACSGNSETCVCPSCVSNRSDWTSRDGDSTNNVRNPRAAAAPARDPTTDSFEAIAKDARRYRRLQIIGVAVPELQKGKTTYHQEQLLKNLDVTCFTNLDKLVDEDLEQRPSRGEAWPLPPKHTLEMEVKWASPVTLRGKVFSPKDVRAVANNAWIAAQDNISRALQKLPMVDFNSWWPGQARVLGIDQDALIAELDAGAERLKAEMRQARAAEAAAVKEYDPTKPTSPPASAGHVTIIDQPKDVSLAEGSQPIPKKTQRMQSRLAYFRAGLDAGVLQGEAIARELLGGPALPDGPPISVRICEDASRMEMRHVGDNGTIAMTFPLSQSTPEALHEQLMKNWRAMLAAIEAAKP